MRGKKDIVEFVGVVVKINGKKKVIGADKCQFWGWEYHDEDNYCSDSGVELELTYDGKRCKLDL